MDCAWTDKREHGRAMRLVRVSLECQGRILQGVTADIGAGGAFVKTDERLPVDSRVRVRFQVPPGTNAEISIFARVVRSVRHAGEGASMPGLALEWLRVETSGDFRDVLELFSRYFGVVIELPGRPGEPRRGAGTRRGRQPAPVTPGAIALGPAAEGGDVRAPLAAAAARDAPDSGEAPDGAGAGAGDDPLNPNRTPPASIPATYKLRNMYFVGRVVALGGRTVRVETTHRLPEAGHHVDIHLQGRDRLRRPVALRVEVTEVHGGGERPAGFGATILGVDERGDSGAFSTILRRFGEPVDSDLG